jgi:hypothetical protein
MLVMHEIVLKMLSYKDSNMKNEKRRRRDSPKEEAEEALGGEMECGSAVVLKQLREQSFKVPIAEISTKVRKLLIACIFNRSAS